MALDQISTIIGQVREGIKNLNEKLDRYERIACESRDLVHAELRIIKHDLRGVQQLYETQSFAIVKLNNDVKDLSVLPSQISDLQRFQTKLSLMASLGAGLAAAAFFILEKIIIPAVHFLWGKQ